MMMSLGVRCVGFTSEGTGFTVKGGGEFSFHVCRGMMHGLMKETAINTSLHLSYPYLLLECPSVTRTVVYGSADAAGSLQESFRLSGLNISVKVKQTCIELNSASL